jgi:hypothetical protein
MPAPVRAAATAIAKAPPVRAPATHPPVLAPSEGAPVTGAGAIGWSASGSWLDQTMLKPPFTTDLPLDDVLEGPLPVGVSLPQLLPEDDRRAVYEKLRDVPLDRMLVSPGYRYYRFPSQLPDVLAQVREGRRVDTRPSIIDVHTDGHGHVLNVDLRSHHLRMAAFLETGAKKLGDLPFDQVLIKIDGMQRGDDRYFPMRAHGYAVPPEVLAREGAEVLTGDDTPATVEIPNLPNWELGSRTSLKQFHATLLHRTPPKVGMVSGEGDLIEKALALRAEHGLDEVVLLPTPPVDPALLERVKRTDGVNLYLDQPASLRQTFPDNDYPELVKYRLNLIYGVGVDAIVG